VQQLKKLTQKLDVLYVEDDTSSQKQLTEIFSLFFSSVTTADDGQKALQKYKEQHFDIVITDINMPNMNGIELIQHIRKINEEQHVIIISAHNNTNYLLQAIELGIDSFIIKPVQTQQLQKVLQKVALTIEREKLAQNYQKELQREVKEKTKKLALQYITDSLTGLYNKSAFLQDFKDKQEILKTLMLISIDNYDSLLITYGYDTCDYIIQDIASFLQEIIPKNTTLYRLDRQDFAFVCHTKSLDEMHLLAQEIQKKVAQHEVHFESLSTRISVTIALAHGNHNLLKKSYMALKEAQKSGKSRIVVYQKNSQTELLQQKIKKIMPHLRKSIEANNIVPYFQAIIDNRTNRVAKYESLARIVDDNGAVHTPADFIDVAQLTGMLSDITRIMIDKSFKSFQNNSFDFSINISEHDLNDDYLQSYLADKCKEYMIEPSRVTLEVLEGISVTSAQNSLQQLMNLKSDGFLIAIDDFGVQNSNFERVHSMQVDYIKIDGSFIKNIDTDEKSYHVVKTISDFGKSINAKIIAEYVHSKEVQKVVLALGIDYSQGYYFSKPQQSIG